MPCLEFYPGTGQSNYRVISLRVDHVKYVTFKRALVRHSILLVKHDLLNHCLNVSVSVCIRTRSFIFKDTVEQLVVNLHRSQ